MKRQLFICTLLLIAFASIPSLHGDNIHMRYFESADSFLMEERFQLFSYAAAADEQVTVVAYGVEGNLQPSIVMRDQNGQVVVEDRNESGNVVAVVDAEIPQNGIYTFLVTRRSDEGGLMRVMLFEGEPIDIETSLLDTVDPFLPSRAYLLGGNADEPVTVTLSVVDDESEAEDTDSSLSYPILAARGTSVSPPAEETELTPADSLSWANEQGDVFYTLNVRAGQAGPSASQKMLGYFSHMAQTVGLTDIRIDVNGGTDDPTQPDRQGECVVTLAAGTAIFAGPGENFVGIGTLAGGQYEVIGQNGDYFLVVDPASPTGGSWVQNAAINTNPDCLGAVFEVNAPALTPENSLDNTQNNANSTNTNPPQGIGLPPLDNDPGGVQSGQPTEEEEETGDFIDNPEPENDEVTETVGNPFASVVSCGVYDAGEGSPSLQVDVVVNRTVAGVSIMGVKYNGSPIGSLNPTDVGNVQTVFGIGLLGSLSTQTVTVELFAVDAAIVPVEPAIFVTVTCPAN